MLSLLEFRELLRAPAGERGAVNVEDPGLVAVKQNRLLVRRERASADPGRGHELLDRVLLDRARLGSLPRFRGHGSLFGDQGFVAEVWLAFGRGLR